MNNSEKTYAVLVVDMLNDFVTGALKCDRGLAIVPKTSQLLAGCREKMFRLSFVICPVQCISLYLTKVLLLFLENYNTFFVYIIRFYQSIFVHFH